MKHHMTMWRLNTCKCILGIHIDLDIPVKERILTYSILSVCDVHVGMSAEDIYKEQAAKNKEAKAH